MALDRSLNLDFVRSVLLSVGAVFLLTVCFEVHKYSFEVPFPTLRSLNSPSYGQLYSVGDVGEVFIYTGRLRRVKTGASGDSD